MKARLNYYPRFPEAFAKMGELGNIIKSSSLDKHTLHLVNLRASQINGCAFCVDMHVKEAAIDQERALRLHHVAIWEESPLFTDKEKAALAWTEVVTTLKDHINEAAYMAVREYFDEKEVVELTAAIGMINFWNRFSIAFRSTPGSSDKAFGLENSGL